ncbi:MAG: hypothetical protein KIS87_05495 [Phycisphaeraceae bacterium]|nr:hypothetical protein [Phycisphaeraceae bacterium]
MKNVARTTQCLFGGTILAAGLAAPASAQVWDRNADPQGWANAIAGYIKEGCTDFNKDPFYPLAGFPGPATSAGAGPISPGTIYTTHSFNSNMGYFYNMVTVGPHYGFGNSQNWLGANYFVDSFRADFSGCGDAVELNVLSIFGSAVVDLTVYDANGVTVYSVPNNSSLGVKGNGIYRIDIFDAAGGAEGVQGMLCTYCIPAPGTAALLAVGGLVAARRRR